MPLLVCATPIGNLDDVTLRVLCALREADVILCEDTRHTRILLDRHGIEPRGLTSVHRLNEASRVQGILSRLADGDSVALVTDAGTPGIADPGFRVIRAALDARAEVHVLPGPSAVTTALLASGFAADDGFRFLGWLPRKDTDRGKLWEKLRTVAVPAVAFEAPGRLGASLASLAAVEPERPVAVCRELTKRFEEVVRGSAAVVAARYVEPPRGEIVVVIGPGSRDPEAGTVAAAVAAVAELVRSGTPRKVAVTVVSRLTSVSRNVLYATDL